MAVSFCPDGMRNTAWGRLKREDVLIVCSVGCRRQSVRPVYGKPQKWGCGLCGMER
ncbi:ATP-dependent helicase RecQ [Neisseria macacae ATCC 33926]|uniref:ATP-dependent helicase RecQ n=1 Tax=Neisseria macacae ATCC 33926 TaxID=997348 RepID=A0AA36UG34_9NEIS|nr:ATP-dependent helicase RecQ [Neisseria macacae ATCC 33926]